MNVLPVSKFSKLQPTKVLRRNILQKNAVSNLKNLNGPEDVSKSKKWLMAYVAANSAIAAGMSQMPGYDEAVLSGVEAGMVAHIFNKIYKFNLSDTALKSVTTAVAGSVIGTKLFKLASKGLTWIPGLGNGLNAAVAGTTTAILGASMIGIAEEMDKARKNGKRIEDFLDEMETGTETEKETKAKKETEENKD